MLQQLPPLLKSCLHWAWEGNSEMSGLIISYTGSSPEHMLPLLGFPSSTAPTLTTQVFSNARKHLNSHTTEIPHQWDQHWTDLYPSWPLGCPDALAGQLTACPMTYTCLLERAVVSGFRAEPGKLVLTGKMRARWLLFEAWGEPAESQPTAMVLLLESIFLQAGTLTLPTL